MVERSTPGRFVSFFEAREKTTWPYTFGAQHTQSFEQINDESELEQAVGNKWFGAGRSGRKRKNMGKK